MQKLTVDAAAVERTSCGLQKEGKTKRFLRLLPHQQPRWPRCMCRDDVIEDDAGALENVGP